MRPKKTKAVKAKRGFGVLDREKARKDAIRAVKVLRKVAKDAGTDLSVHEVYSNRLRHELDLLEQKNNEMLPPVGSEPKACLRGLFEEDDAEQLARMESSATDDEGSDTDQERSNVDKETRT